MNKFLVTTGSIAYGDNGSGTIANSTEIDDLTAGAIVLLNADGSLVPAAGYGGSTQVFSQFSLATTQGMLRSGLFAREGFEYEAVETKAGVNAAWTISLANVDVADPGTVGVSIIEGYVTQPIDDERVKEVVIGFTGIESLAAVVSSLALGLNDIEGFTASIVATTSILITGTLAIPVPFHVNGTYAAKDVYTVVDTTNYVAPVNLGSQIAQKELEGSPHSGNMRYERFNDDNYKQDMQTDVSTTYTTYIIKYNGAYDSLDNKNWVYKNTLTIAVPTANTTLAKPSDGTGILDIILASV